MTEAVPFKVDNLENEDTTNLRVPNDEPAEPENPLMLSLRRVRENKEKL